jgi:xylulose-5-phosphate/fructose-6-phosphate phosphoketolase
MPGKQIPVANPPALPSHLPDSVLELSVQLKENPLPDHVRQSLRGFQRAAEYIAAGNSPRLAPLHGLAADKTSNDISF